MNIEMNIFQIIANSGDAKSIIFEAIQLAKTGQVEAANAKLIESEEKLSAAHREQTALIQTEAQENGVPVSLLLIHAQDHLMNTMLLKDLAREIIELYSRIG